MAMATPTAITRRQSQRTNSTPQPMYCHDLFSSDDDSEDHNHMSVSTTEPYNLEAYLLADNKLRYKPSKPQKEIVPNDSKRGRKPRKGSRGLMGAKKPGRMDNLPERVDFSVTKEAMQASTRSLVPCDPSHASEINQRLQNIVDSEVQRWIAYTWEGFNLMLHGFGSKLDVLDAFREYVGSIRKRSYCINGLLPKINARKELLDILNVIGMGNTKVKGTNINAIAEEAYQKILESNSCNEEEDFFIFINNFDSLAVNHPNLLTIICTLLQLDWIHLIATADNVNAGMGITQSQSVKLNFCWIPCSTFQSYDRECKWTPNIYGESNGLKGTENTLKYVLKSLTANAKKAFSILASLQLSKMKSVNKKREFMGVEFTELLCKCKENFIARSDTALKTLLVEFIDHKLVTQAQGKKGGGGSLLNVVLDIDVLEKIVKNGVQ